MATGQSQGQAPDVMTIQNTIVTFSSTNDLLYLNGSLVNAQDVANNGNLRMQGNAQLILLGNLVNQVANIPLVTSGSAGIVRFMGALPQTIDGVGLHRYHKIYLNTGGNASLLLNADFAVRDSLRFLSGNIDLANHGLMLGSTGLFAGESNANRAFSNSNGFVEARRFTSGGLTDLGGIGAQIQSSFDTVVVRRYHNQYLNVADSSILRNMELTVRNGSGAAATLDIDYFDDELDGIAENNFAEFSSTDQLSWAHLNSTHQPNLNAVSSANIQAPANVPKRYTIASEDCSSGPVVNLGPDQTICFGDTALLDADNPGFSYRWNTGASSQTLAVDSLGLDTAQIYWVEVTDLRGCRSRDTIGVHGSYNIVANLGPDRTECTGIPVTLNLGNGFSSYLWNTGATTSAITVNAAGTYSGTIQNFGLLLGDQSNLGSSTESGATTAVSQVFVAGGSGELASVNVGFGPTSSSGNLTLTLFADSTTNRPIYSQQFAYNAGTTSAFALAEPVRLKANRSYRFELSAPTAFKPMTNASYSAGYSSIAGQDLKFSTAIQYNSSCPATDSVVINYLPAPTAPTEPDTMRCGPGAVTISVVPGGSGANVKWYADSTTATVLFTGTTFTTPSLSTTTTYYVSTLTAGGCESLARDRVCVNVYSVPVLSATTTAVACFGNATGAVDLTVTSGTPAFSYLWNNGATTQDLNAVAGGSYTVTVSDAHGCSANRTAVVSQPAAAISSNAVVTNVTCNGAATGAIDLSVAGGTSPYTYLWSNGASTQDINLLGPGTYTVTITDAHACSATRTASVTAPGAIALSTTVQNPACAGQSTGSIDLTANGGSGLLSYLWSNGATTQDLSNVGPGTYTVTVSDANNCTNVATATVTSPSALILGVAASPVQCHAATDGAVDLTPTGGTAPYTYQWSNGSVGQDLSSVAAGIYFVTVTDQAGCQSQTNASVSEPTAILLTVSTTQSTCGSSNGTATVLATGGSGSYSYSWPYTGATTASAGGFPAGTYSVIVTDGNGCVDSSLAAISDQGAPTVTLDSVVDAHCHGNADGEIYVSTTGGIAPINYLWSNGATTEDNLAVPAGQYGLTVTDNSGCVATVAATVTEPTALTLSLFGSDPACAGNATGSVQAFAAGGQVPYSYAWSNGATTQNLIGALAGIYSLTVTDVAGCSVVNQDTLVDPAGMATAVTGIDPACHGMATGSADLSVTGGTGAYTFLWSDGQVSEDASNLVAGNYYVTVSDQSGCSRVDSILLQEPALLVASDVATNVSCFGAATGAIDVSVVGGTLPYGYLWAAGDTTEDLAALTPGIYGLTVTDGNGCVASLVDSIAQPAELEVTDTVQHIQCGGGSTGAILLTVAGGTPSYDYLWSNGLTTADITGQPAGTYAVTVTDAQGCTATLTDTIVEPAALVIADTVQGVTCLGHTDGAIFLSVSGGLAGYAYQWSNGDSATSIYGLVEGAYTVTVTDARGCTLTDTIDVTGGDSALQAVLVAASYVDAEDTLYLYELSMPVPTEVFWDFGDGDTSALPYPVHIYARNVNEDTSAYQVKLIVRNSWCVDSVTQTIYVNNNIQKTDGGGTSDPNAYFLGATFFPNPNSGAFSVRIELSDANAVELELYDLHGRKLVGRHLAGEKYYESDFQLTDVARGVYLVKVTSGRHTEVLRVAIF